MKKILFVLLLPLIMIIAFTSITYSQNGMVQLINGAFDDIYPQINEDGYIVWQGWDGTDWEIFLYDGMSINQITDNLFDDSSPIDGNGNVIRQGAYSPDREILFTNEAAVSGVTILTPNGGEAIPSGSIYTISWDRLSEAVNFSLFYSLNNGITWNLIDSNLIGTSYNWVVPIPRNNKKKCIMKVIGYNISGMKVGEDTSDGTFKIEVVKVTSPNGGEIFEDFNIHTITWLVNGTINPVEKSYLYYTDDRGTTWKLIAIRPPEPTSYPWRTPMLSTAKTRCKVKVVLKDAAGKNVGIDVSDKFFTIEP